MMNADTSIMTYIMSNNNDAIPVNKDNPAISADNSTLDKFTPTLNNNTCGYNRCSYNTPVTSNT